MKRSKLICTSRAPLLAMALCVSNAGLAGNTWTGGGSTPNWSDNNNWGGSAPTFNASTGTLTFTTGGAQGTTSSNNSISAMNKLNWTGSLSWTLNGSTTLFLYDNTGVQAKIENQSTGLVTINGPIIFAANNGSPPNPFGEINAVSGDITFGAGTLTVNGASVNGVKFFGSGHVTTFNNTVSASGKWIAMTSLNGSTLAIGGSFTSGDIYVMNGGTLSLNAGGSLSTGALRLGGDFGSTGNQNQTKGGTFQLTALAGGQSFGGTINTVGGNSSNALLIDSQNTSGANTLSGSIYLDSNLTIQNSAGGALMLSGVTIDIKSRSLIFNSSGSVSVTNGITSSTSGGSVVKNGGGTLTLNGPGNYTGGTTVNAGMLLLGIVNALPTGSGSLALGGASATLDLNGKDQTIVGFNDNGGQTTGLVTNNGAADATFTVNDSGLDNYAGAIADGTRLVAFVKNGGGVMTLAGSNTYTGATSVNGGTLALGVGGSLGNTAITLNSGGTFSPIQGSSVGANSGSSGASLTVKSGATLDMTSGGTGTVGTFTINPGANSFSGTALNLQGGTLKFDLGSNSADQLVVNSGTATVGGINYVTLRTSGLSSLTTGTYTLISASGGGLAGTFQFNSGSPLYVVSPSIIVTAGSNSYRLWLNSTPTALQLVIGNPPAKATVNIMPLGASITEGASADNPYNGGGYRSKLYQYLANDGRYNVNFVGSNTRLFEYNPTAPNILTTAGQLHNEGHFGSTTWQILNNLDGYDNTNPSGSNNLGYWITGGHGTGRAPVYPDFVTLNVGGNDYVSNPNDPFVVDRLNQIITTVSYMRPGVTVLVSNLAWRTSVGPSINSRYNPYVPGMVYNLILNGYHVQFVDMYGVMSPNDSNANLSSDQVHPSQAGYNLMADTWWKSFAYGAAFWTGNQDALWNTIQPDGSTNWARDYTRSTDRQAVLDAGTDGYFNNNNSPITTLPGADVSIRGLNFASGASAPVTIGGSNTVTIGSGGMTVQANTGAHVINANVALGSGQTWSNISANPLTVNGAVSGSHPLKLVGPSFFNFGGTNTSTGEIAIDSGGLWIGPGGSLSGQGFVYVGNGGGSFGNVSASLLSANTSTPVGNAIVTNKADTGSGLGSGTRAIGGTNTSGTTTYTGSVFINGGTVLTAAGGGTVTFTSAIANGTDTGNVSHNVTITGGGIVRLAGTNTFTGSTTVNGGGTLQLDGVIAGSVTVSSNSRLTGSGAINQNLTIGSGGIAQFNGGTFTVNNSITNNGLVVLGNGARFTGSSQSFINNGTLDIITAANWTPPSGFQNNGVIIDSSVVKASSVTRSGNNVSIAIDSYTGHVYQLQRSSSLNGGSFTNIGAPQAGSTGTKLVFTDSEATGASGFYRVVVAP